MSQSSEMRRKKLVWEALVGFCGTFAAVAVAQAVANILRPEPEVWPALLALVLVIATVALWRSGQNRFQLPPDDTQR
ncbi:MULTISPECIES: hypothetical protein [Corynebacterium]|uniref:hypothetical protein n=1 Tax=Corynebacterium TaxID=1716 RepID=UPI00124E7239|nr:MULTISPECIES: hypothetical protein [Corynebacterium]